ncbi:hypothetical protein AB0K71_05330 [Streptomyces syringium]|uniref:hypothetical protein n=1 Tax=Streptomyces syringium TaxID=76729 RepID=UPI0033B431AA
MRGLYPFPTHGTLHFLRSAPPWLEPGHDDLPFNPVQRTAIQGLLIRLRRPARRGRDAAGSRCSCGEALADERGHGQLRVAGRDTRSGRLSLRLMCVMA